MLLVGKVMRTLTPTGDGLMISRQQQAADQHYMKLAIALAEKAKELAEVPVGAVVVMNENVIGSGYNRCVIDHDPCAHAEVMALREAAKANANFRLDGATMYVSLEPCLMCCGALLQARLARLVFGAREPRTGGVVSVHESLRLPGVDHHIAVTEGVFADESAELMRQFFELRR